MFFARILKIVFCLGLSLFSVPIFAGELLTLDEAVSQALQENPGFKAEQAKTEAYKARIGVAKSLDDPMVGVEFYDVPISTRDVTQGMETNYSLIQKIPFPGKLKSKGKVAENEYLARRSLLDATKLDLIMQTEHAFHDLYYAQQARIINKALRSLWKKLVASEEARYETGKNSSQNLAKAKIELDKLESEAALLEAKEIQEEAKLNVLRHRDPSESVHLASLPETSHLVPSYETFEKVLLKKHPEIKAVDFELASQKANVSSARKELALPDFQTRFTYAQRYGLEDAWTGEVMLNIPFFWSKNRKALKEAKAMERAMEQEKLAVKDDKLGMLKETYARYQSSKKIVALFRVKILPHAKIALQSAQAAYQIGDEDFLSLVDTARQLKESKLGFLEALVAYHRSITDLKSALGVDFTKEDL